MSDARPGVITGNTTLYAILGDPIAQVGSPVQFNTLFRSLDYDGVMLPMRVPPADSGKKLTADEIALLKKWIDEGGVWAKHWAYQPPQKPQPPATAADWRTVNPIKALTSRTPTLNQWISQERF